MITVAVCAFGLFVAVEARWLVGRATLYQEIADYRARRHAGYGKTSESWDYVSLYQFNMAAGIRAAHAWKPRQAEVASPSGEGSAEYGSAEYWEKSAAGFREWSVNCAKRAAYEAALEHKYRRAARYPWLTVAPDPPESVIHW